MRVIVAVGEYSPYDSPFGRDHFGLYLGQRVRRMHHHGLLMDIDFALFAAGQTAAAYCAHISATTPANDR